MGQFSNESLCNVFKKKSDFMNSLQRQDSLTLNQLLLQSSSRRIHPLLIALAHSYIN